jgi:hypothetical protein
VRTCLSRERIGLACQSIITCATTSRCRSAANREPAEVGSFTLMLLRNRPKGGVPIGADRDPRQATYFAGNSNTLTYIRGGVPLPC